MESFGPQTLYLYDSHLRRLDNHIAAVGEGGYSVLVQVCNVSSIVEFLALCEVLRVGSNLRFQYGFIKLNSIHTQALTLVVIDFCLDRVEREFCICNLTFCPCQLRAILHQQTRLLTPDFLQIVAVELQIGHDFFVDIGAHNVIYILIFVYQFYHVGIRRWSWLAEELEG